MSGGGFKPVGQVDPVIPGVDPYTTYGIPLGTADQTWRTNVAASNTLTNISFQNFIPQDKKVIIDARILIRHRMRLTFGGTSTVGKLLNYGVTDAMRAWPFASAVGTNSVSLTINGQGFNEAMDVFQQLTQLGDYRFARNEGMLSTFPSKPDILQNYSDWQTYGAGLNVLGNSGTDTYDESRGAFAGVTIVSNTPTSAVVDCDWYEPILVAPLKQYQQSQGLQSINSMSINITVQNFARIWSHDQTLGNNVTSITPSFNSPPTLYTRLLTPFDQAPAHGLKYPFAHIVQRQYTTDSGSCAPLATRTMSTANLNLSFVPREIVFFVRKTQTAFFPSDYTAAFQSDCAVARIISFNVQWGSTEQQFTSASEIDHYRRATANSYPCTWSQWQTTKGSIIKLVMGKDVRLDPGQYVGQPISGGTFSLNNLVFQNINTTQTMTYDVVVCPIFASMIQITADSAMRVDSIVAPGDVAVAISNLMAYHSRADMEFTGAGILDYAKSAFNVAKQVAPYALKAIGAVFPQHAAAAQRVSSALFGGRRNFRGGGMVDDSKKDQYPPALMHDAKRQRLGDSDVLMLPRS